MNEWPAAKKLSHTRVRYEHPSSHEGKNCEKCVHFIPASPPRCEHVRGPILAEDYCKNFEVKEQK